MSELTALKVVVHSDKNKVLEKEISKLADDVASVKKVWYGSI